MTNEFDIDAIKKIVNSVYRIWVSITHEDKLKIIQQCDIITKCTHTGECKHINIQIMKNGKWGWITHQDKTTILFNKVQLKLIRVNGLDVYLLKCI